MKKEKEVIESREAISVGAIALESSSLSLNELAELVLYLLDKPSIREYLNYIDSLKKISGGNYVG